MAIVPKIPNTPPLPIQWQLFHQFFVDRYQGDPKGARFYYIEGEPEHRIRVPRDPRRRRCFSSRTHDPLTRYFAATSAAFIPASLSSSARSRRSIE